MKLRHPVVPDDEPFIQWRRSMTDEAWVDWNAVNDDDWYEAVQNTFGLDGRYMIIRKYADTKKIVNTEHKWHVSIEKK